MRNARLLVVLMFALGLVLGGCQKKEEAKKEEAKKEEAKKPEKKAEEPKAEEKTEEAKDEEPAAEEKKDEAAEEPAAEEKTDEPVAEEKTDEPVAEEKPAVATSGLDAKGTVEAVFKSLQAKQISPIIDLVPPKYIADLEGVVHDFANAMDKEMWEKSISLLDKTFAIAKEQKGQLAVMLAGMGIPVKADDLKKGIDALVDVWGMMKEAGLTDLEKLKTIKLADVAKGMVPKLTDKVWGFADETQKAQMQAAMAILATAQVKVGESSKDEKWGEVVEVEISVAGETEKGKMVVVDGKWIPIELAEEWDDGMKEAKEGIKEMAAALPTVKTEVMTQLAQFEGVLDQVQKSGDLSMLQNLGGMMMGMPGPGAAPMEAPKAVEEPKAVEAPAATTGTEEKKEEAPAEKPAEEKPAE